MSGAKYQDDFRQILSESFDLPGVTPEKNLELKAFSVLWDQDLNPGFIFTVKCGSDFLHTKTIKSKQIWLYEMKYT